MVTAGMLPRAAVREVEARLRAAGCPDKKKKTGNAVGEFCNSKRI